MKEPEDATRVDSPENSTQRTVSDPSVADDRRDAGTPSDEARYEIGDMELPDYSRPPPRTRGSGSAVAWLLVVLLLAGGALFAWYRYLPLTQELSEARRAVQTAASARDAALAGNRDLQAEIERLQAAKAEIEGELARRDQAVTALEHAQEELQQTQDELQQKLQAEIQRGDVLVRQSQGQLVVDLVDKILFDSGEAELSDSGKAVLRQVGETLLKVPGKLIHVAGHTDSFPISAKLAERFPSNWELSSARATNVVRFLQDEVGVPGERLVALGYGPYRPVASNATRAGRHRNRRIEVMLVPDPAGQRHTK